MLPEGIQRYFVDKTFRKEVDEWKKAGKPIPPPHPVKQAIIESYQEKHHIRVFIETGTLYGNTIWYQMKNFDRLYSIELSEELCEKAKKRFKKQKNISIIQGDSGIVLKDILKKITQPAVFWLDGHYSSGDTAKGEKDCPIIEELNHIFSSPYKHVLLIDDARCFTNSGEYKDYPTIPFLKEFILAQKPESTFEVKDDIIRIEF